MTNDEGFEELAVGRHRRPANFVAAFLILAMAAVATVIITVPAPPTEASNVGPPSAIGGGPPATIEEPTQPMGGVECQTTDGAPYVAHEC